MTDLRSPQLPSFLQCANPRCGKPAPAPRAAVADRTSVTVAPASRNWPCHTPCTTGYTSAPTRTSNTPSSPGLAGAFTGEQWTTGRSASNRCARLHADCSITASTLDERKMMLNVQTLTVPADSSAETGEPDSSGVLPTTSRPQVESTLTGLSRGQGRVARRHPSFDATMATAADPWSGTLTALLQFSAPPDEPLNPFGLPGYRYSPARMATDNSRATSFTITVLEHMTNSRVCLSWHDPTLCNYEEQVWTPALARRSGRCALSGVPIRRGDAVYRPQTRGQTPPANADAMILASALAQVRDG
ncbi:hypothetical protein Bxe_A2887 [Paraburkholderia xenovorans LB400]|uniref:DUF3331 domain-containing protein n=2 Tax=Paraburkholderia xenovorans TaxID=36873 RepID=Q141A2_PARXL|nr:hypothetical protein Bxe_A2887 [Paraburkholderia xenovorans LB400]